MLISLFIHVFSLLRSYLTFVNISTLWFGDLDMTRLRLSICNHFLSSRRSKGALTSLAAATDFETQSYFV